MHWQNETTGKLKPIVRRARNGESLSAEDQAIMDAYLAQAEPGTDPMSLHSMDTTPWALDAPREAPRGNPAALAPEAPANPIRTFDPETFTSDMPFHGEEHAVKPDAAKRKPEVTPENKAYPPPENKTVKKAPAKKRK